MQENVKNKNEAAQLRKQVVELQNEIKELKSAYRTIFDEKKDDIVKASFFDEKETSNDEISMRRKMLTPTLSAMTSTSKVNVKGKSSMATTELLNQTSMSFRDS